jgi:membrane-associated phospholipid phosphatase
MNWTDTMLAGWHFVLGTTLVVARPASFDRVALFYHGSVIVIIISLAALQRRGRWWRIAHDWYPLFLFITAFEEVARLSLAFVPHWQDRYVIQIERALFSTAPTAWLNRHRGPIVTEFLEFGYFTFYWIMPVVGGLLYEGIWRASPSERSSPNQPFRIWMDATVLGYIVCFATYLLFPTEGPAHTLMAPDSSLTAAGPFHRLVLLIQRHGGVHGNAFPSGHIMASVVAYLAALKWQAKLAKWITVPLLLMCVGAVYDGYHYVSDIVAGAVVGATAFWVVAKIRRANPSRVA